MNLIAELHRSTLDPTLRSMLVARLEQSEDDAVQVKRLSEQTEVDAIELQQLGERIQRDDQQLKQFSDRIEHDAAYIKSANLKIAALTLELAHRKRIHFGSKSEAFTPEQRELFQETGATDVAAMEAELEAIAEHIAPMTGKAKKPHPTGRQALPAPGAAGSRRPRATEPAHPDRPDRRAEGLLVSIASVRAFRERITRGVYGPRVVRSTRIRGACGPRAGLKPWRHQTVRYCASNG